MSKWFAALPLAVGMVFSPVSAEAMTLAQAIKHAIKTNPRIESSQASRRATDKVLDQATGRYFPEVELSGDIGRERIDRPQGFGPDVNDRWRTRRQATLTIRQTLFDGWDRANDVYQAQARISAAARKVLARSEAVALNVVEAYIDVTRHNRLLHLASNNVKRHRRLLSLVKARVDGGTNSAGDLDQTRERLFAATSLVEQIRIARNTANAKFREAVGLKPRRLKAVNLPRLGYRTSKAAFNLAVSNNPRLRALRSEIEIAEARTEQFKSTYYPTVTLEGSASKGRNLSGTPGRSDETRGLVVARWKLFDGGVRVARVEELTERKYEKVAEYDTLVRSVRQQIETAWTRVVDGRTQVASIQRQLGQNRRVVDSYRREYEANKRSLLDVLDAENSRFGTEFELSNVRAIRLFSAYQLIASTGKLLRTFNVARPAGSDDAPARVKILTKRNIKRAFTIPALRQD